jgi:hypothetical protein
MAEGATYRNQRDCIRLSMDDRTAEPRMNEDGARRLALVRAIETEDTV